MRYTEGILQDGAVILDNGKKLKVHEVIMRLNAMHEALRLSKRMFMANGLYLYDTFKVIDSATD